MDMNLFTEIVKIITNKKYFIVNKVTVFSY